ncbi:MAG TPA: hypothetical protein VGN00_29735 [Puia sp.]|jgi:hypothetical protein
MNGLNEESSFNKMKPLLVFLLFVVVAMIYQFLLRKKIAEQGIYTKCTLVNTEGYKGGLFLVIKYAFKDNTYEERVHGTLSKFAIGRQYFIKLLPGKPAAPLLLEDNRVPECLEASPAPAEGWKEMPVCK